MFGDGFMYVAEEEKEFLPEGDYKARIVNVVDNQNLSTAINVNFQIEGHPNCNPFCMTLFSRPIAGSQKANGSSVTDEDLKKWDRTMSRFFDAFGIEKGDFNFIHWKGHSGWVTCKKIKTMIIRLCMLHLTSTKKIKVHLFQKQGKIRLLLSLITKKTFLSNHRGDIEKSMGGVRLPA